MSRLVGRQMDRKASLRRDAERCVHCGHLEAEHPLAADSGCLVRKCSCPGYKRPFFHTGDLQPRRE